MKSCYHLLLLKLTMLAVVVHCGSSPPVDPAPVANPARPAVETGELCTLEQVGQTFFCDLQFSSGAAGCEASVNDPVRREFLQRMTVISLQLLYLDGERGAMAPFRYNNPATVLEQISVRRCQQSGDRCNCRLAYQDPELLQIFYDSAGCRRSSRLRSHPLYFQGFGCE